MGRSPARTAAASQQDAPSASESLPASPSSARRRAEVRQQSSEAEDLEQVGKVLEDEEDGVSDRAPPQADMSEVVQRVKEGLRGEAILIARDIGLDRLCQPDGLEFLLERIKQHVFPLQSQEASELFRVGQLRTGPLSRQQGKATFLAARDGGPPSKNLMAR